MKKIIGFVAVALIITGCSKEEVADVPADAPVVADETTVVEDDTAEATGSDTTLEVVEESSSDPEPESETIVLAQAESPAAGRTWKFREGKEYTRIVPAQPTVGGADKIEVAEVFMYSCPHCMDLEGYINPWAEDKNPNVRFVRIPAIFNQLAQLHAQLYYTEYGRGRAGLIKDPAAFRSMVFDEYHRRGNRMASEASIQKLFERAGVSADDFQRTWSSFEVNQKLRVAGDLARRYNVTSVPVVIVNGKYRTSASTAGSYPALIEVIDELTEREGLR